MHSAFDTSEGLAHLHTHHPDGEVFFNPKGKLARSVGVLALRHEREIQGRALLVADVFTGIGARAIRYLLETSAVEEVHANDFSERALQLAKENARLNGVQDRIRFSRREANRFLWQANLNETFYDFLDLDTFGSPTPYLDAAFFAVRDGGLLYLTTTDLGPLCGVPKKAAYRHYGAAAFQWKGCHESGARTVIANTILAGGRHDFLALPLLTLFDGYSFRILFRTLHGRQDFPERLLGFVEQCPKCGWVGSYRLGTPGQGRCPHCRIPLQIAGPLWLGELHDPAFLEGMMRHLDPWFDAKDAEKIAEKLRLMTEEVGFPPYFLDIGDTCDRLNISTPGTWAVIEALRNRGYRAARSSFTGRGVKTTAPYEVFLEVLRDLAP